MFWLTNTLGERADMLSRKEFEELIASDQVQNVTVIQNKNVPTGRVEIEVKAEEGERGEVKNYYVSDVNQIQEDLAEWDVDYELPNAPQDNWFTTTILPVLLMMAGVFFLFSMMNRQGGGANAKAMSFGKSRAKLSTEKDKKITFAQVAGLKEEKEELEEVVDFLKSPKKYIQVGARIPKGILLVGPPGTGKTLLAKAVAGEADVPFFTISGSDFVEMFVGMGASRVRDLFKQAEAKAPCIVFIDEIDAIGKSRDNQLGSNDEREQTLNQLLTEMDGFDESKAVVILAATNRPEVLDKALRRPGRFDRTISVTQPDKQGRIDILKVHSRKVKMDETVDLDAIALATSGASGADLANIVNEAALRAVRMNRRVINQEDLFESVEVIIAGQQRKNHIMSRDEREIVAFHEIGHALVAAKQKNTQPIQKITIIPRTSGALGYTMQMPEEERFLMKKSEMLEELVTLLGGRAAEEVQFGNITTGASNDIEKATDLARKMVTMYGMSDEFGMMGLELPGSQYMDGRPVKTCADETMVKADEIVRQILEKAYQQAVAILRENQIILQKSAGFLLDKETITGQEFMEFIQGTEDESPVPLTE